MNPERSVSGASEAFEIMMAALRRVDLSDEIVRRPSLLPGWSIGHVLTHLARNANSYERLIRAAKDGQVVDQYPGGVRQRQQEIDAGSTRPIAEQLEDLIASEAALAEAFNQLSAADWHGRTRRWGNQAWPVSDIPFLRWREVSIHSVDVGLGDLNFDAWSEHYVETELRRQLVALPSRLPERTVLEVSPIDRDWKVILIAPGEVPGPALTLEGTSRQILAWLVDRARPPASWPQLSAWQGIP